jgi:UMF1 family MFS transporter
VQGGVQSLSRSFFATLVPKNHEAQYFGFYNMMGKFATVIGPLMIGTITLITGDIRLGFLSLLLLFGFGMFFLKKV